jgi:hypothetical protein
VNLETMVFVSYLLMGPCAWALFAFGMLKGRKRLSLLDGPAYPLPEPMPSATVLVPVKDEARQIEGCLTSVLALSYPGRLQILAIDDRSSDGTGPILDRIAADKPGRLEVIHIRHGELPAGWTGKSHALHVGMRRATGQWLLFVDSDVVLRPDVLRCVVALAEWKYYDLLSLLPRFETRSFWERLIVPLGGAATSAMYFLPMSNYNELPNTAFANGQFMCVRRSAYDAVGGHEAVKQTLSEDLALARLLKRNGFRPRISLGAEWASTRMYSSLGTIVRGWSRQFFSGSAGRPWRVLCALSFVLLCCFSGYAAVAYGATRAIGPSGGSLFPAAWLIAGLIHLTIMTAALAATYKWTGNPAGYALLFPLGAVMMIAIWMRTLQTCLTGSIEWRGTRYAHRMGHGLARASTPSV